MLLSLVQFFVALEDIIYIHALHHFPVDIIVVFEALFIWSDSHCKYTCDQGWRAYLDIA